MDNRLTVELTWQDVDVHDFTRALDAELSLVREVMEAMDIKSSGVRWIISTMRAGSAFVVASPLLVGDDIEMSDLDRAIAVSAEGFRALEYSSERPPYFSDKALDECRTIASIKSPTDTGITRLTFGGRGVEPTRHVAANVDEIVTGKFRSIGSIEGVLNGVVSAKLGYRLTIRDRIRNKDVQCMIPKEMRKEALDAFERCVIVRGILWSRKDGSPQQIEARTIQVIPANEELPTIADVRGILRGMQMADGE